MKNIFLVEDEHMIAELILEFFEEKGFKVDVAYTLQEGLDKYDPEVHDVVLLDISLKADLSFPILKKIKETNPKTKVFMFSGYDSDEYIMEAKKLGADGFIPKPFRIEFLCDFLLPKLESFRKGNALGEKVQDSK